MRHGLTAHERGVRELLWSLVPPSEVARQGDEGPQLPAITDDDALDKFLRDYFNVALPHRQCCTNHSTPWDAFHDAYFARHPISVWKASRGMGGKSFTLSALAVTEALTLRADVNILGGSGEQSKRVLESIGKLWEAPSAPRSALMNEPGSQKQRLVWGNRIVALMASQASVRGPHPQRLRLDETDEMKLSILDSALGQPMSKGWILSQVVLSSTHQYPDGTMTEILKRAAAKNYPVYEWCYRENLEPHGWLSLAEVERKRAILTAAMWETEIELQEPSSEGRAMDTDAVKGAFRSDVALEAPVDGAVYGTGTDWAKKVNHTVIVTIRKDVRPMRVVAVKRTQREPWPAMAGYLDARIAEYGGTSTHDNTGLGQVVHDMLRHDSEPFNMVGRDRADLLSEYIAAIEKGELVWPEDDSNPALAAARSEHIYATREDVYRGSKDGSSTAHLPDTISAGALAWRAASQSLAASAVRAPEAGASTHLQRLQTMRRRLRGQPDSPEPEPATAPAPAPTRVQGLTRRKWFTS
jgi:hypothetical protein